MRLDISNLLVALLVVHEVRAGPLRPVKYKRQEENFPECQTEQNGGVFGDGNGSGKIRDPQANPDASPSPEICLLPTAGSGGSEDATDAPSSNEPSETATRTPEVTDTAGGSQEPTGAPEGPVEEPSSEVVSETSTEERSPETPSSSGQTTPTQTDNSPVVPTEEPSSGVESETCAKERATETTPSEEPSATDAVTGDVSSVTPSGTEAEASGTLAGTSARATRTVTVTAPPADESETGTDAGGAAPTGAPEEPGFTTNVSPSEAGPSATQPATEGTDASTDESASPTGAESDTSAQPAPSEAPSDSSPNPTITPTGSPNPGVPQELTQIATATASVSPDVFEDNLKAAKAYNEVYASLTSLSACSEGQIACVEGSVARCSGVAFNLESCNAGQACLAVPMSTSRRVIVGCVTEEQAAVLGAGAFPSESAIQAPSESASQPPSESPSEVASEAPNESATEAPSDGASETPSESTQAPSQPADDPTTTVRQDSTLIVTSVVATPTKELIFTSILTGPLVPPSSEGEPEETPAPTTEPGAVIPTTLGATEPAETEEPFPTSPIVIEPVGDSDDEPEGEDGGSEDQPEDPFENIPIGQPIEIPISFDAPIGSATRVATVTVTAVETETVTETVTVAA